MSDRIVRGGLDVLLTGPARSGTTLACWLLNQVPHTVALHEPMVPTDLAGLPHDEVLDRIGHFLDEQRQSLLSTGMAWTKVSEGNLSVNSFPDSGRDDRGLRVSSGQGQWFDFGRQCPGFTLAVKHPAMFTALLPHLVGRWPCYALVRNPLATLLSWCDIDANVRQGRAPAAEMFDPELRAALNAEPDTLERQMILLSWCLQRYLDHLPAESILRYEDLVATRGASLSSVLPAAGRLAEPLGSRNLRARTDPAQVKRLSERLLANDGVLFRLYPRSAVEELRAQLLAR